jgi:hypothetical protein
VYGVVLRRTRTTLVFATHGGFSLCYITRNRCPRRVRIVPQLWHSGDGIVAPYTTLSRARPKRSLERVAGRNYLSDEPKRSLGDTSRYARTAVWWETMFLSLSTVRTLIPSIEFKSTLRCLKKLYEDITVVQGRSFLDCPIRIHKDQKNKRWLDVSTIH